MGELADSNLAAAVWDSQMPQSAGEVTGAVVGLAHW